ncbi:hypothetical protein WDU94_006488 [Cyamophila willieti]
MPEFNLTANAPDSEDAKPNMPELNQTDATDSETESMRTADECLLRPTPLCNKGKKKKVVKNPVKEKPLKTVSFKNPVVRKPVACPPRRTKIACPPRKTEIACPPCKTEIACPPRKTVIACPPRKTEIVCPPRKTEIVCPPRRTKMGCSPGQTNLSKNNLKNAQKKVPQKRNTKSVPCVLKRSLSSMCDPLKAMCNPCDPCQLVLDCDNTDEHRATRRASLLRKGEEPRDLNLLRNILANAKTEPEDLKNNSDHLGNKAKNLRKLLDGTEDLLKKVHKSCPQSSPHTCCQQDPWQALLEDFQQNFYTAMGPCGSKLMCPGIVKSSQSVGTCCPTCCRRLLGTQRTSCCCNNCLPCCGRTASCIKCQPCCGRPPSCVTTCPPCCLSRKISTRSVRNDDLKFKSREWLLERNQLLQRRVDSLRKLQRDVCHTCCEKQEEQTLRGHASFLFWKFLMESMVKALVESHPAARFHGSVDSSPPNNSLKMAHHPMSLSTIAESDVHSYTDSVD